MSHFGRGEITFAGDRWMIKGAQLEQLLKEGFHYTISRNSSFLVLPSAFSTRRKLTGGQADPLRVGVQ